MVFDIIIDARQDGARQEAIGFALKILGQHSGLADALQFAPYRYLETAESPLLKFVSQSALQPGTVMVIRSLIKVLVPHCPDAVHVQQGKLSNASRDCYFIGQGCVCRHGRTPSC